MQGEAMNDVMDTKEAAEYLRIHPVTMYRKAEAKEIPGWKIGNRWRFRRSVLEKMMMGEK